MVEFSLLGCGNENGDPHPSPYKHYSCICYLNENYSGGEKYVSP